MPDVRLVKPAAGISQNIVCEPQARFVFDFPTDAATLSRSGDNLVLTFEDGSSLQLENFYTAYSSENMPSFSVEGVEISGQDFFAAMNEPDLMPAAGPASNAGQGNGARYHEYTSADLLDGLDRLDGLDVGWTDSNIPFDDLEAFGTDESSAVDYSVTITPGIGNSFLSVSEKDWTPETHPEASGNMLITAPDGVASIVFGGVTIFENGAMTGNLVTVDGGHFEFAFDESTGRLDYTFVLDDAATHDKSLGNDEQVSHNFTITVTDTDGDSASGEVRLDIIDDMPTLTVGEFSGAYGEGIDGTVNFGFGADNGEGAKIELSVNGGEKVAGVSTDGGKTWTFTVEGKTVTLNAETGEFHYDLPASGSDAEYSFQFTVTDADGDMVSAPEAVNVKVEGTDLSGMKGNVIGDDANVLTETAVSVTMPELPAGVTLVANQTVNVTDEDGTVYGQLIVDAEGNVTFKQTEAYSGGKHGEQGEELATGFSGSLNVTLADGTESSITVDVSIRDDMPTLTVGEFSGAYGEGIDGTVNFDFGADNGEGAKIELSVNGDEKVAGVSTDGGKTWTFTVEGKTVTLNAETGEFHYDLPASGSDAEYSFQFTVTDADGDMVSAPEAVNVKVEGTDLSGMKGNVIGDDANVLTETAVSVTMPELPAGVTLVANQTVNVTDEDGTVYGQLIVDAEGNVTFKQTEAYSGGKHGTQGEELATGFSGSLNVTLADGTESSITVDVSIRDDMPTLTVGEFSGAYGEGIDGTVNFGFGADNGEGAKIELSVNGGEKVAGVSTDGGKTWTFTVEGKTVTLNAETGEFHYDLPASGSDAEYSFQFTVTDADGDVVSAPEAVNVKVEGTDLSGMKGNVIGDDANVLTETAVSVTMPELPAGVTLVANQTVNVTDTDGTVYGQLIVDAEGNVTFKQTEAYSGGKHGTQGEELATGFSGSLNVTLADGTESSITVDVSIRDDMPTLTVGEFSGAYGEGIDGTVNFGFGADNGEGAKIELSVNGGEKVAGVSTDGGKTWTFTVEGKTMTLNAETGEFHYDLPASGSDAEYSFQFTVTDADGDMVSAPEAVNVKVEGTDLSGMKGNVIGDDANVLTETAVSVTMPELPAGVTLVANQTVNVTDTDGTVYGQLIVDAEGNVTFKQTEAYSGGKHGTQGEELATGFSGSLNVTLADGTESSITVDVSIRDDMPTLTVGEFSGAYGEGIDGTVNFGFGADNGEGAKIELSVNGGEKVAGVSTDGGKTWTFTVEGKTVTLNAETGEFHYDLPASGSDAEYSFQFTVTDADGDVVSAPEAVNVKVEGTDLSGMKGNVIGDDANVLTETAVSVTMPELPAGVTLVANQTVNVTDTDGTVYGQLIVDAEGNVTFKQTEAYSGGKHGTQGEELATGFSGSLNVTLADGTESSITVDVSIRDDMPTLTVGEFSGAYGEGIDGTVNFGFGADNGEGAKIELSVNGGEKVAGVSTDGGKTWTFTVEGKTVTLNAETGEFHYDLPASGSDAEYSFQFTVTDADGDVVSAPEAVNVKVEGTDLSGMKGNVIGDDANVLTETAVSVTMPELPAGVTLVANQTVNVTDTDGTVYGQLIVDAEGNVTFKQTEAYSGGKHGTQGEELATGFSGSLNVTLADGTESSITVDVSIRDDMPTLTVGEFSGAYGEGIDGTVNFGFGADNGEGAKIELSVNGGEKVAGVSTDGGKTWTFTVEGKTVTLNAETGEFHYDLPASGSDAEYSFQFTVTDADGDVVSAPEAVNVKVEGTDLSGMKGNVIGDDANVLTETAVSVTMPELPAGVTLVANQTVNVTDTDGTVYGQLIVDAEGNVTFKQTEAYSGGKHGTQGEELATGFSGSLNVTLADGTESSITVDVSIRDDMPTLTVGEFSGAYGEGIDGTVNFGFGADNGEGAKIELSVNGGEKVAGVSTDGGKTWTFTVEGKTMTLNAETGEFHYDLPASGSDAEYSFQFTVTDADGDVVSAPEAVNVKVEGTDLSGMKGNVIGDDANVLTETAVSVTMPELPAGVTLVANQTVNVTDEDGTVYGQLIVDAEGNVTFKQTEAYSGGKHGEQGEELATGFSGSLNVTLADGTESSITVDVSIRDDMPTLTVGEFSGAYGEGIDGTVNFGFGADNGEGAKIELSVNGGEKVAGVSTDGGKTWTFTVEGKTVTLNAETGEFHYDLPASGSDAEYSFQFTVTDADGDVVSAPEAVNVKVEGTDLSGMKGNVIGDDANVLTETAVSVTMPELPAGVTLVANQTVNVTDTDGTVYGQLIVDAEGNVTFKQTEAYSGGKHGTQGEELATGFSGSLNVTLADGTESSITVDVSIRDDMPIIEASTPSTSITPGGSGNNLVESDEVISFTEGNKGEDVRKTWWNGQVEISAAKVTYEGTDSLGHPSISEENPEGMSLGYSFYNGGAKQYYKNRPPQEDIDSGIAQRDNDGKWYREAPKSDWGLTVNGGEGDGEIQASDDNTSEAVVINLKGYAYGMTINFGAFFAGKSNPDDPAAGTGYDTVSEKALITFYKDGKLVYSTVVEGTNSGEFTFNTGDVVLEGFDKVVISAVDNGENSDFTIQGFDFITKRDDAIIVSKGEVKAESGADGFADAYMEVHAGFDLESIVTKANGNMGDDGTGTIEVQVNGETYIATLQVSTGSSSGESILTATLSGGSGTGSLNGQQLFTATLDKDGNWSMEQYEQFRVDNGTGDLSNEFELVFKTEDADGDVATTTVNVPLEVKSQEANDSGDAIGNSDDRITIAGDDGVAGTVAAGDSGGMTEGQQIEANYNVCFILDMSSSMSSNRVDGRDSDTRLEAAEKSIQNFIKSIESNSDFTDGSVTIAVIPFAERAGNSIEITVNRVDGKTSYSYGGQDNLTFEQLSINLKSAIDQARVGNDNTTAYGPAFEAAANWFDGLGNSVENATGNITYFLTDGCPAPAGSNEAGIEDYQKAWNGYQKLLAAQGDGHIDIHAIGFGNSLSETDMENLAMFDNTGTQEGNAYAAKGWFDADDGIYAPYGVEYQKPDRIDNGETYYVQLDDGRWQEVSYQKVGGGIFGGGKSEWGYYTGTWPNYEWNKVNRNDLYEQVPVSGEGGVSQKVTDADSLTAAFESGFKPGALASAGNDTITAEESASSVIVYGDVMNTDMLLNNLNGASSNIAAALVAADIDFGSGSKVFQWLEEHGNSDLLKGTDYEGWSHGDTVKYMLEHHEELGYETRVDGDGKPYLVDASGNVLNMDGTSAHVSLDELTGRTGGDDVITGSGADDFIFGQEGDDIISGGLGNDALYGGTGDDILFGDEDILSSVRNVLNISDDSDIIGAIKDTANDEDALTKFINAVEGAGNGGDDQLFGGSGDDLLFGMGGNDYLSGGEGEDFLFGGSGNDIIVYDKNDYLVDGGSGIDFMVSNEPLTLDDILNNENTNAGPLVNSIEVLITGEGALDLTNINQLAEKYGITLGENADGEETLSLDMSKWTQDGETNTYTSNDGRLTLETNLERVDMDGQDDAQIQQHMFILQNGQGS